MKNFKKAVSMFLAVVMLLAICVCATAETSEIKVLDSDYAIADKLSALEIIDVVDDENLATYVKREDMIPLLMKYLRMEGTEMSGNGSPFLDVSYADENVGAYRVLYWAGYIAGDDSKCFRPDDLLTYNEAVTFIINAMGYRPFAVRNGGYPAGYLYTANKYGMLKGLRGSGNSPIPYCDLYRIIEASILADSVLYRYTADEDDTQFELNPNMSILEELYGYEFVNGVVTGNENTRLLANDSSRIDRYQIEIEGNVYDTPGKEFADLLGKRVYAYLKKTDFETYDVIYLEPVQNMNKEYKLSAEDILKDKTTSSRIYYEDEDFKEKHINLDGISLSVIYNGKSRSGYGQLKNIMPDSGYVLGIDNTGDEVIDVLFIYEFENIVVGAIDVVNMKIYDKFITTTSVPLDKDVDEIRIYNENGESMEFEDIAKGDVLSVMKSANATDYKLIIVYDEHKVVEGKVTEIVGGKYKIGDEYYETAENFDTYVSNSKIDAIVPGLNATFFLDREGKIAYYEEAVSTDLTYGFLAGIEPGTGLDKSITVMVYNEKGVWLEANLTDKVIIDEHPYDITKTANLSTITSKLIVGDIMLYKLSGNKISKIDTRNPGGDLTIVAEHDALFKRGSIAYERGNVSSGADDSFVMASDMLVFNTPDASQLMTDTEAYEVKRGIGSKALYTTNASTDDNEKIDGFVAYKIGPSKDVDTATCILFKGVASLQDAPFISETDTALSIYSETTQVVDKEGETKKKIYVLNGGEKQGYIVDETKCDYTLAELNLGAGDIIQYALNNVKGTIENISIVYRTSTNTSLVTPVITTIPSGTFSLSSPYGALCGATFVSADIDAQAVRIYGTASSEVSGTGNLLFNASGAQVTLYNKATKEEKAITIGDMIYGDTLIVRCSDYVTNLTEVLVIR